VQLAVHGNLYFRDRVMRSLERVVMGVIGYQERLTFKEVEEAMAHRSLEVPTDIARLFEFKSEDGRKPADGKFVHLLKVWGGSLQNLFSRLVLRKETPDEYSQLEEIIDYLENQLEIKHGG
jgi:RNase P/RNase MRP subunit p29